MLWLQLDSNPPPINLQTKTQPFSQTGQVFCCVVGTCLYGAFECMFLSYHVGVSEWIQTLLLPASQGTPCSKQVRYLKFKWLQLDTNPQPLNS